MRKGKAMFERDWALERLPEYEEKLSRARTSSDREFYISKISELLARIADLETRSEFSFDSNISQEVSMYRPVSLLPSLDQARYFHAAARGVSRERSGEAGQSADYSELLKRLAPPADKLRAEYETARRAIEQSGLLPDQVTRALSTLTGPATVGTQPLPPWVIAQWCLELESVGAARRLFMPATLKAKTTKANLLATDVPTYWVDEAGSITPGEFSIGYATLTAKKLAALMILTSELAEDVPPELVAYSVMASARAMAVKEDLAAFIGDATDAYGGFTGLVYSSTNIVTMDAGKTGRAHVVLKDLSALKRAVAGAKRFNAKFMLGPLFYDELCDREDTTQRPLISVDAAGTPRLFNTPIELIPALDSVVDAPGAPCVLYGDPRYAVFGTRRELRLEPFEQGITVSDGGATLSNALQADLLILRATQRIAFDLIDKSGVAVLKTAAA